MSVSIASTALVSSTATTVIEGALVNQTKKVEKNLTSAINEHSIALLTNPIIDEMSVIDWGKANARNNEIIQKDILRYVGIDAFDPQKDSDCPNIDIKNNSPGFDILVRNHEGKLCRVQSKLRQVKGKTDFSQQTHFETTRRHSKKNEGVNSNSGHVAYAADEFDYVMVSLINVREGTAKRSNVSSWSFSIIPISALVNQETGCCMTHISAKVLQQYKYVVDPTNPPMFA